MDLNIDQSVRNVFVTEGASREVSFHQSYQRFIPTVGTTPYKAGSVALKVRNDGNHRRCLHVSGLMIRDVSSSSCITSIVRIRYNSFLSDKTSCKNSKQQNTPSDGVHNDFALIGFTVMMHASVSRMNNDSLRGQTSVASILIRTHQQSHHRVSRQLATISQICLPFGTEYQPQRRLPPRGTEAHIPFLLIPTEEHESDGEQTYSITARARQSTDEEDTLGTSTRRILFLMEPVVGGLVLFPIIALFWYCGWNLGLILSNHLNHFPLDFNINQTIPIDYGPYSWQSLLFPYLIVQFLLLVYYLWQDSIYTFLEKRMWIIRNGLLQFHIIVLATIYILQWKILWSVWDQSTLHGWQFEITFSVASLFATIAFTGHLSDLVCSPFLLSYDSIDYCVHFGCSLLTRGVSLFSFLGYDLFLFFT